MEAVDEPLCGISDTMTTPSDSPAALGFPSTFESSLDPYLYSTLFHQSFSPQLQAVPSLEGTPTPDGRKEAKKRERKKQPKLEYCTAEQIAVCTSAGLCPMLTNVVAAATCPESTVAARIPRAQGSPAPGASGKGRRGRAAEREAAGGV